jgi:PAS domain S-box-containing protein
MYTVFYVDDEPDLLELGREFLEQSQEFRVVTLSLARDALGSPEIKDCDAIVSDYQMGDMDGIAFLKAVREQYGDIPFILFTGRGREEIVIQAINNGADSYIQKGGDAKAQFAELEHRIRQAVARRQAEHSLVESEKRLADIINFLPDATFAIDKTGRVIAWNHAIEEMTGVPAGEMLGKGDHAYAVPFYGERQPILIDRVFEPDKVLEQHYTHISHDRGILTGEIFLTPPHGRPRTLMATAGPLYNRRGGVDGAIESLRDISVMRSAEEALRESEGKYRLVVEHSQDAVYIHRSDRVVFANNRASEMTGYTHEELLKIRLWDLVHPDDRDALMENAKKRFAGEEVPSGFTARLTTKDGGEKPCEFFADLVIYQGAPAILGIARDITVRKEAEDSLRASEARFRELAELLPQLIFETDKDLRVTYMNRRASTVTGLTQDDLERGCAAFDFIAKKDHKRAKESIGKVIRGESIDHHEYEVIRRNGTRFAALIYAAPILHDGAFSGLRGVIVDVSERKQAEETLRESEEKYRTLVEGFEGLIYVCSKDYRVEFMNRQLIERTGRDATGEPCYKVLHDRESVCPWCVNDRVFAGEKVVWEAPSPRDNRWNHIVNIPIHHTDGSVSKMAMISDITERKRSEEALRASEEQFQMALEASNDGLVDWDMISGSLYLSPRCFSMLGYIPGEPPASIDTFMELQHPDDRDRIFRIISEYREGKRSDHEIEFRLRAKDGGYKWFLSRAKITVRDTNGKPARMVGTVTDITRNKQAEAALRESEAKYRHILENLQDAYFRADRDGNLTIVSPSAARIYGYGSPEEMIGIPAVSLYRDRGQRDEMLEKMQESGRINDYTGEARRKDGSLFWASISVQFLQDREGHRIGTEAIVRDISDRRTMEHAIQEANRKLNLLNTITRHDVVNQLTALQGYVQLACLKKPDPVITDFLHKIQGAADTIDRQIALTQVYQELGVQAPAWFALDEVVPKVSPPAVPVRFSGTCREVSVLADPMLERVFFNLFENAVRHGKRVTAITVRCEREPDGLLVIVEDDGVGVKPHEKEKIFTKGYGKNTGFGLFLSREILAITGISIRETGSFGKGARFEMLVPKGAFRLPKGKEKKE